MSGVGVVSMGTLGGAAAAHFHHFDVRARMAHMGDQDRIDEQRREHNAFVFGVALVFFFGMVGCLGGAFLSDAFMPSQIAGFFTGLFVILAIVCMFLVLFALIGIESDPRHGFD